MSPSFPHPVHVPEGDPSARVACVTPAEPTTLDDEVDLVHGGVAPVDGEVASVPQTEAMVLNLDDPFSSTPSVLELELQRMNLEELRDFEACMEKASIASGRTMT